MHRMRVTKPRGRDSVRDTLLTAARDFEKAAGVRATHVCVPSKDWGARVRRVANELGLEIELELKAAPGFLYLRTDETLDAPETGNATEETDR